MTDVRDTYSRTLCSTHLKFFASTTAETHGSNKALIIPGRDAATVASCGAGEESPAKGAAAGRHLTSDRRGIASGDAEQQRN